jgi:CubicO group peptidase (beta-lactamase class C family)
MPLLAQPGVAWNYSEAMGVLGRLVEVLAGSTFREFLVNRVFKPLAMVDTDFYVPKNKIDRLIPLYQLSNDRVLKLTNSDYGGNYGIKPSLEYGGAGLVGTAADYLRFAQMLLNDGELDGVRLLSASSVRLIMTDHLGPEFGDTPLASLDAPVTSGLGLGFGFGGYVVRDASSAATLGSDGEYAWGGWASTDFWIDPKRKLIGILLTQVIPIDVQLTTRQGFHDLVYQAAIEI